MLARFLLPAGAVALVVTALSLQQAQIKSLTNELALSTVQINACGARLDNLLEDIRSDNSIDNLDADALRDVPADWLLVVPSDP